MLAQEPTDMLLVTPTGQEVSRADRVALSGLTPPELSDAARVAFGQEVWLLHDGGVGLGRRDFPARFEALTEAEGSGRPAEPIPGARSWQRPGWRGEVLAWIEQALGEAATELECVSSMDLAAVLKVQTQGDVFYFKTDEDGREARAARQLSAQLPDLTPRVLAADLERGWLLTQGSGNRLLGSGQPEHWLSAVQNLATLHREARLTGVPTHRFAELPGQWAALLSPAVLNHWGLDEKTQTQIRVLLPRVLEVHGAVTASGLPEIVCHGDFHANNVLVQGDTVRLFDLSETAVAHPLTDIGWFLAFAMHPGREVAVRQGQSDLGERLWNCFQEASGLQTALSWRDVALLALFHRAAVYDARHHNWTGTLPGFRPGYVPYYLRIARLFGPAAEVSTALS